MEKNCIYCNNPLDIKLHGLTKYCSNRCRNKDYYTKKKIENEKQNDFPSGEELSESNDNSFYQSNNFHSNGFSYSTSNGPETTIENKDEKVTFPEVYKIILDEKGKNFELLARINKLELQNEALLKENQELLNENEILEAEIESNENQEEKKNATIMGLPLSMVQSIIVQLIAPHADKIIAGLTGDKATEVKQ